MRISDWSSDVCSSDLKAPGIDWPAFFAAAQLDGASKVAAYHPGAITGLSALVASQPLYTWKDWLTFHQINSHSDVLPSAIDTAHFAFYGTRLAGTTQQRSRDKRALAALYSYLGVAMGRPYAEDYVPLSAKARVDHMSER